jgi:catechol 2,3-dioxygenase-like lactoylglutathione lyase family enzyme
MIHGIHHVGLAVANVGQSAEFFSAAFDFADVPEFSRSGADGSGAPASRSHDRAMLMSAPNMLVLLQAATGRPARSEPRPVSRCGITHICVQATSMAEAAARASAAGAAFHAPPTDLGGDILYAYPRSPEGNVIELEAVPRAGEAGFWIAHVSLSTSDLDRAVAFYEALLGEPARRSPRLGPNEKIDRLTGLQRVEVSGAWIGCKNAQLEFWQYHNPPAEPDPESWLGYSHLAFEVDSADEAWDLAARVGVTLADGPPLPGAVTLRGRDPDGNVFLMITPGAQGMPPLRRLPDCGVVGRVEAARAA